VPPFSGAGDESDGRDARFAVVDARYPFVGELRDSVQRRGPRASFLRRRRRVGWVVDRGGARIHHAGDSVEPARDGVEHVDRARHVDVHAEGRVGANKRNLERSEVDYPGDLVLVERTLERREIGDVALDQLDPACIGAEHELEAAPAVAEVIAHHGVAVVEHASGDPRAQAAQSTRHEHALGHGLAARNGAAHPSDPTVSDPPGLLVQARPLEDPSSTLPVQRQLPYGPGHML